MAKIVTFKNNLEYYLRLYDSRMLDNDLLGALDACRSAYSHAKTRIDRNAICLIIGQIYFDMQLYSLSCDYYFRAVCVPSTRAGAYLGIARNLIMLGKFSLAIEYLDNVLTWDFLDKYTQDVLYWNNTIKQKLNTYNSNNTSQKLKININNLFRLGKFAELDTYLSDIKSLYPTDYEFAIMYAKNKIYLKDYTSARKIIFDILNTSPNHTQALLLLARLCVILEDYNTAREYLSNLLKITDLDTDTLLSIGGIYFELKEYSQAITCFIKVLDTHAFRPKLLLFTAISYYNLNDTENALYYIGKARWLDFDNPLFKQFYKLFKSAEYNQTLPLSQQLPQSVIEEKINNLISVLDKEEFSKFFFDTDGAEDDISWCMTLDQIPIIDKLSNTLTKLKNKKAINLTKQVLLSSHYSIYSKFCVTKNAITSGNYKYLDLNSNFTFRSFKVNLPNKYRKFPVLLNAIANARAYIECYANKININNELHFISDLVINKPNIEFDEYTLTCTFFYQYHSVLSDVCRYFQVPLHSVQTVLNSLGVD